MDPIRRPIHPRIQRRRDLAASLHIPPELGAKFTVGERAVLKIVSGEVVRHGACTLTKDAIADLSSVSSIVVKVALRTAKAEVRRSGRRGWTGRADTQSGRALKRKEFRMDWGRLVTNDANETYLLRSYVVRVTDVTFGYEAEQAAADSGVPAADGRERMWKLLERGALRLVGPITDDDRIGVEPCDSTEWHEQAKKNRPLVEWRRQMAATADKADDQGAEI